jgi:hypothetical protein
MMLDAIGQRYDRAIRPIQPRGAGGAAGSAEWTLLDMWIDAHLLDQDPAYLWDIDFRGTIIIGRMTAWFGAAGEQNRDDDWYSSWGWGSGSYGTSGFGSWFACVVGATFDSDSDESDIDVAVAEPPSGSGSGDSILRLEAGSGKLYVISSLTFDAAGDCHVALMYQTTAKTSPDKTAS